MKSEDFWSGLVKELGRKERVDEPGGKVNGLSDGEWQKVGVTTKWSVRDALAHLASYEHLLEDSFKIHGRFFLSTRND